MVEEEEQQESQKPTEELAKAPVESAETVRIETTNGSSERLATKVEQNSDDSKEQIKIIKSQIEWAEIVEKAGLEKESGSNGNVLAINNRELEYSEKIVEKLEASFLVKMGLKKKPDKRTYEIAESLPEYDLGLANDLIQIAVRSSTREVPMSEENKQTLTRLNELINEGIGYIHELIYGDLTLGMSKYDARVTVEETGDREEKADFLLAALARKNDQKVMLEKVSTGWNRFQQEIGVEIAGTLVKGSLDSSVLEKVEQEPALLLGMYIERIAAGEIKYFYEYFASLADINNRLAGIKTQEFPDEYLPMLEGLKSIIISEETVPGSEELLKKFAKIGVVYDQEKQVFKKVS